MKTETTTKFYFSEEDVQAALLEYSGVKISLNQLAYIKPENEWISEDSPSGGYDVFQGITLTVTLKEEG